MPRIRLFQVIASSGLGGAEQALASLVRGLDRERFDVSVACHGRDALYGEFARHADRIWSLDLTRITRLTTVLALARRMRETRCDIVHTHLWTADVLGGLAARLAGVPHTVSTVHSAYFLGIGARGVARLRRRTLSYAYRAIYTLAHRVIAVSEYVASDLRNRRGYRVPARKIEVVYNGLDPARLAANAATESADPPGGVSGRPVIATVANFDPIKGHEWLIRAVPHVVERFPDARFVLAGDGPARDEMEALADALGVRSYVVFSGRVACAPRLMATSDLVVVPSISEGLGMTLLEALALGTPVVATRAGAIPEVIGDDEAGVLVPSRDPEALAQGVIRVLSDPDAARRRAERGRALVRERFSVEAMVRQTERMYLGLLAGGHGGES